MEQPNVLVLLAAFGMSGKVFHGPLVSANPNFKLWGVVERNQQKAGAVYPEIKSFKSFSEGLKELNHVVDGAKTKGLVVVNVPDSMHFSMAKEALEAGFDVVVEKPVTIQYSEAKTLQEIAQKKGKSVFVFQNRRWDSDFLTVKSVVQLGQIGKITAYEAHFDRFRNYVEQGTWKEEKASGTGTLYNLGSHLIDQALYLFGMPEKVWAYQAAQRPNSNITDTFEVKLFYKDGLVATLKSSYLVKIQGPKYQIHSLNGSFVKYGADLQEEQLKQGWSPNEDGYGIENRTEFGHLAIAGENDDKPFLVESFKGNYPAFYEGIINYFKGSSNGPIEDSYPFETIRIIEAAIESHRLGQTILL